MKISIAIFLLATTLSSPVLADEPISTGTSALSDAQRIDSLIQQNRILTETNAELRTQCDRPKTKEEAFAACMQAAKGGSSPMAAESIGGHCDQLLKK
jgi:hypothetical protein